MKINNWFFFLFAGWMLFIISGCHTDNLVDTNERLPDRNWSYVKKIKAIAAIKDPAIAYNIRFKLRITADYSYSNIYILMHLTGPDHKKVTRRYEYRLAEKDGRWRGTGSGNLYTYELPLLVGYRFAQAGDYTIEVEQNMRDNPLKEVSDAGISVALK